MPKSNSKSTPRYSTPLVLFCIGLSAGACAALFPRLMPLLLSESADLGLMFFTTGYLIVVIVFSVLIGVVMMWSYWGTTYKPQTLFMAALGIPSLLSGSLNMSSNVNQSSAALAELVKQRETLVAQVENLAGIETITVELPAKNTSPGPGPHSGLDAPLWDYLGVAGAHAQQPDTRPHTLLAASDKPNYDPRVQIQIPQEKKDYRVVLASSTDKTQIEKQLKDYQKKGLTDLRVLFVRNEHYLVTNRLQTKNDALQEALRLKRDYGVQKINLLQVK